MSELNGSETLRERFLDDCVNWMECQINCEKKIVTEKCGSVQDMVGLVSSILFLFIRVVVLAKFHLMGYLQTINVNCFESEIR